MNMPSVVTIEYILIASGSGDAIDSTQPYGDFLGGIAVVQDGYGATPVEPAARPAYFDGKLLSARDLMGEQVSSSDTGFDLM